MTTDGQYVPSDEDWVPTEEEVRHYARACLTGSDFDRFLARIRRDAWNEGAQAQADTYGGQIDTGPNPYEETP